MYQAVGYEDGTGVGKFTASASNFAEIANNFLGLGSGLSLSEFSFTPSRFGVLSPKPDVDYKGEGKVIITPDPVDTCEVRLRANEVLYSLKGQVFALGEPVLPRGESWFRFSAEFFELVTAYALEKKTFKAYLDPDSKRTLHTLEAFASLNDWCQTGTQVDLQVWTRGHRVLGGTISLNGEASGKTSWGRLAAAMRKLRGLLVGNEDSVTVSLNEVVKGGQRLAVFTEIINTPSMRLEFEPTEETPSKIDSLIFYSFAEVGDFLFFALYESELTKETPIGSRRQLVFGAPKRIDSYAIENPTPQQREQMGKDYQRFLETRERQCHPAGLGEILAFSQATVQPRAA
jgi:hypothetical protein